MQAQRNARRVKVENRPGIYYRLGADGKRRYEITYLAIDEAGVERRRWRVVEGNLEAAQAELDKERDQRRRGERRPSAQDARQTLEEVAEAWLPRQVHLRASTRKLYALNLAKHVYPRIGRLRVADVREDEIASLVASMAAAGYSPHTIRGVLTPLGRVLSHAARRGLIPSNPIRRLERGERPSGGRREMRILDHDEIGALLQGARERYRPLIATAIFTGLRLGELLGLTWADVDFAGGLVGVRKQLDRDGNRVAPKTPQAVRDVVLMDALAKILRAHKARSGHSQEHDFVFASDVGTALHYRNASRRGLEVATERAGIGEYVVDANGKRRWKSAIRFHDLRHTFASLVIAQGANVVFASRQLGHASPDITLRVYAHLFDRAEHAARTRGALDAAFGNVLETSGGESRPQGAIAASAEIVALQGKRN